MLYTWDNACIISIYVKEQIFLGKRKLPSFHFYPFTRFPENHAFDEVLRPLRNGGYCLTFFFTFANVGNLFLSHRKRTIVFFFMFFLQYSCCNSCVTFLNFLFKLLQLNRLLDGRHDEWHRGEKTLSEGCSIAVSRICSILRLVQCSEHTLIAFAKNNSRDCHMVNRSFVFWMEWLIFHQLHAEKKKTKEGRTVTRYRSALHIVGVLTCWRSSRWLG